MAFVAAGAGVLPLSEALLEGLSLKYLSASNRASNPRYICD
jgi:hypothetical protein